MVYGLRVTGLAAEDLLLPAGNEQFPTVEVSRGSALSVAAEVTADRAVIDVHDGRFVALDRARGQAVYSGPPLSDDDMVHPYFGPVSGIFSRWAGRESFHAGAFELGGRAWAVRGVREAGKSSLLAALAARGVTVLADDAFITDGAVAYTGPRCIDLRRPVPGVVGAFRHVRAATRHRLLLPAAAAQVPVGGWIFLRWSDEVRLEPVPAQALLGWLAAGRSFRQLDSDPSVLLALAARPAWILHRPRAWSGLEETSDALNATLGAPDLLPVLR